ncbi:hypothetical protein PybrP1_010875 [[Pythium] brassicae (nom. inval.)]|nr:hypothetical protein PybrP1_010875 [[Pythium] brassicae (nom. inval.)]
MTAMAQMNDVLLGDDMSMMGCDVDTWSAHPATSTARPHFVAQPTAFFACPPPANLTRHVSLPVAMMRQDIHFPAGAMHFGAPTTPAHAHGVPMGMPPVLVRHHSHGGYIMSPHHHHHQAPVHFHQIARPVNAAQMRQMLELSISHQHHQQQQHQQHMKSEAFAADLSVEPMPFTSASDGGKLSMDGDFDLEPLSYAVFGASERPKNLQHFESAIESLDRLLPDLPHDVFQQQQLAANVHITPRNVVYGRGALPLLLSPHGKDTAASPASASAMAFSTMMLSSSHTPSSGKHMAVCKVGGCDRRVRSKGFCKTHGGGRKCNIEGCKKSSQNGDFCIGHGGGKKCKEDGCAKAAQSHGLCKAHGGGARCKFPDCNKSSQGGGLCRAHGGGKRCQAAGCPKGAQRGNFCATHGGFRNCKIDGCVRTDRGGGFCEVHRRGRLCKVDGCKKLSRNQGMCTMHIREEKQEGGVDADVDVDADCDVDADLDDASPDYFRHSLLEA